MEAITSKEKKDIILREIVKPELKRAGYRAKEKIYQSIRDDCYLVIGLSLSRFNSIAMGYSFSFNIGILKGDLTKEALRQCWISNRGSIHEDSLLPDCGFLHPYRDPLGYKIDGYKDYQPQDMDIEEIKSRVGDDLRQHIFPQLAEIQCYEDWERKRQEWQELSSSKRVCLLRYYDMIQRHAAIQSQIIKLIDIRKQFGVSAQEIRENYSLYQQIKALSPWTNEDKWELILAALLAEQTSG